MTRARPRRARLPKPAPARPAGTQNYGLYFTDVGRPTRRGPPFACVSDEDAVRCAEQRRQGRPAELRSGDRLVLAWPRDTALAAGS